MKMVTILFLLLMSLTAVSCFSGDSDSSSSDNFTLEGEG